MNALRNSLLASLAAALFLVPSAPASNFLTGAVSSFPDNWSVSDSSAPGTVATKSGSGDTQTLAFELGEAQTLSYTPTTPSDAGGKVDVVISNAVFTTAYEFPGVAEVGGIDSQAAICVHTNGTGGLEYCGWAGAYTGAGTDTTNLTWFALSGPTPVEGATNTVTMSFDYTGATPTVTFKVGDTTLTPSGRELSTSKTQVTGVSFSGTGSIGEMAGQSAPGTVVATFLDGDGSTITNLDVAVGTTPVYPAGAKTPSKAATAQWTFAFDHWDPALAAISDNQTYTPVFTSNLVSFTITWKNEDGTVLETDQNVAYNATPTYDGSTPTKAETAQYTYTFAGWNPTVSAATADAIYTAKFTQVEKTFTVTWKNYDGTTLETDQNVAYNATPTYDGSTPTKASDEQYTYTFAGWSDGTTPYGLEDDLPVVTASVIYTAQFSQNAIVVPTLALAKPTLSSTALANAQSGAVVRATIDSAAEVTGASSTTGVSVDVDGATATFTSLPWNEAVDWTLSAGDASLPGRFYAKGEESWFNVSTNELDTVTDLPEGMKGVDMSNDPSAAGQMVRIQTCLEIPEGAMEELPDAQGVGSARTGFAVAQLTGDEAPAFYAYTGDDEQGVNGWVKLSGVNPAANTTNDLLIVLDVEAATARYYVEGIALYKASASAGAPAYEDYLVPMKAFGADETKQINGIGFANADGVKAPVVAEYDVPFEAAVGDVPYAAAADGLAAADKTGVRTLYLLTNDVAGTISLAANESVKVDTAKGSFAETAPVVTSAGPGYEVKATGEGSVTNYTVALVEYPITYELNGGAYDGDNTNRLSYTAETPAFTLNNPSKDHYTFLGWTGTGIAGTNQTVTVALGSTGPRAYTSNWEIVSYTITWSYKNASGETVTSTHDFPYGTLAADVAAAAPALVDYVVGDYKYVDGTFGTYTDVDAAKTYTATYTETLNTVTVSFVNWDNSPIDSDEYSIGDPIVVPTNPTRASDAEHVYSFLGWSTDGTAENIVDLTGATAMATVTYTAVYEEVAAKATVISVAGGSTTAYPSLEAAIAAAAAGDTVKLLDDAIVDSTVVVSKNLIVDLGGFYVSNTTVRAGEPFARVFQADVGNVVVTNGTLYGRVNCYDTAALTIAAETTVEGYVLVWGDGTYGEAGCKTPTLTVDGAINTTGEMFGIMVGNSDTSRPSIAIRDGARIQAENGGVALYNGASLTMSGGSIESPSVGVGVHGGATFTMTGGSITTGEYGVYNNGLEETATTIAVSGGTITSTNQVNTACGIYQAGLGSLTLSGTAVVSGPDAVEVRAGSVQVLDNARLVATMPYTEPTSNGNGNSGHGGVALLVSQHTTAQNVAATVSGGTLQGEVAFQEATVETQNDPTKVSGAINGGTILGDVKSEDVDNLIPSTSTAVFSDADAEGVAEGYALKETQPGSGLYSVTQTFVVTYANYDGTALQVTTNFVDDATPAYAGATPTRVDETGAFVYTFADAWSPAVAETVTETVTYTATYTSTSLAAATWVGGASGDWNDAANWNIGYVPTKATVVTFTNNATVGIAPTVCKCKEIVLDNADVTIGRADPVAGADLNFYKTEGSAVSGTGTLALDTVGMFNQNNAGVITIGTALDIRGDVTFKGVKDGNQHAGSWTITGKTTIADGVTVKSIDDAITTFQGDIDIGAGSQVTFFAAYGANEQYHGGEIVASKVTLAHNEGSPATKLVLETRNKGKITISDSQVITDDAAYEVKKSSADGTTTYEAVLKTFTVTFTWHGGSSEETYTYGTAKADVTVPADPAGYVENGTIYTFTGWSAEVPATITDNVTITAQYSSAAAAASVITVAGGVATTNYYASLPAALAAAGDGDTVVLLTNVNLTDRLFVNAGATPAFGGSNNRYATTSEDKALTLDLNGHCITNSVNIALAGGSLAITNSSATAATIATTASGLAPVEIRGTGDLTSKRTLTVSEGVTLSGSCYGLNVFGSNDAQKNLIDVTVDGTVEGMLFVLGNLKNPANEINVVVNGTVDASGATGEEAVHTGIAQAGYSTVTVNEGAAVTGESGIETRAGTLVVNGGTITATATPYSYAANGSGMTTKGAAVAVAQHGTKLATSATLNGGTLSGVKAIGVTDVNNDLSGVTVLATQGFTQNSAIPENSAWVETATQGVYELVPTFTVLWVVEGTTVETDEKVPKGMTPEYNGQTPTKEAADGKTFEFLAWDPAPGPITGDTTYTATFKEAGAKVSVIHVAGATTNVTFFADLAAAVVAAQSGDTVKLLENVELDDMLTIGNGKTVTLDLNGKTISDAAGFGPGDCLLCVAYGGSLTIDDSSDPSTGAIVASDAIYGAVKMTYYGDDPSNGTATLVVDGGAISGASAGICGNGTRSGTAITVNGGSIAATATDGNGIFHPQNGTLAINGGEITGASAVYLKSGTLTVTGGTLTGTGAAAEYQPTGNGGNPTGDALVIDTCAYPGGNPTVSIEGGTFISQHAQSVGSYATGAEVALDDFIPATVTVDGEEVPNPARFSDADADGVPEDYKLVADGDTGLYKIEAKVYVAQIVGGAKFESLEDAVSAAAAGDTMQLLDDIALTEMTYVPNGKTITLDLAGHSITDAAGWTSGDCLLCVSYGGSLTIDDSSDPSTGTITASSELYGAVKMTNKGDDPSNGTATLVVDGGAISGASAGICGNGTRSGTAITVNGGSIAATASDGNGIFHPQNGTLTITGGEITGATAVYLKSGALAVTGGTITGTGAQADYVATGNGGNPTGDALVIDTCGYPGGNPTANITGGKFISQHAQSVGSYATGAETALAEFIPGTSAAKFSDADADGVAEGYYLVAVEGTSSPVLYEVAPRTSVIGTVVTVADNAVYDGTTQDANLALVVKPTADGTALVLDTDYVAVFATNALVNAGDYNVKVVGIGAWKDETNVTFTVAQRPVTFTGASDEKVYDGSALVKDAFATSDDGLVEGHTATATVTGGQTDVGVSSNVVSAAVIKDANDVDVTANYAITYVDGELTVTPAAITITVAGWNGTYDGTAHLAEVEAVPADATILWSVDGGEWAADTPSIKDVGSKEVRAKASKENYSDALSDVISLTVTKAALSVTAKPKTVTYGEEPANDGVDYSGFVNGETESVLGGTLAYAYTYEQFGNVGSYKITPSGLTSDNYEISFVEGTLTVEAKEVGLEWSPDPATFTYDGTAKVPSATATGLVNNDEIAVTVTGEQTKAGTGYTATATALTGDTAGNYKLPAAATTTFDIEPAAMTITVAGYNGVYDGAAHQASATTVPDDATVTWSTDGGESWSDTVPSVTGVANVAIVAKATLANYAEATATTSLVVTAKAVTFTAAGDTKVYDGTALVKDAFTSDGLVEGHTATATVTGSQTIVGASSNVVSAAVIKDAGDNDVTANYNVTYMDGELKVTAATVDIPAAPGNKVYNGQNQTADVTAPATVEVTNDGGKDAGDYTVTFALKDTANYTWSDGSTTNQVFGWSITQKALKLIAEDKEVAHGAAAPAYSYKVDETDGLVEGDSLATEPTLSCAYAAGDAVGTYTIEISGAVAPNYAITYANGTLTVVSNTFTVIWLADDGTTEIDTTQVEWGETPTHADAEKSDATGKYEYRFAAWTPAPGPVTEATNFVASFTTAIKTPLALTVADEKLDSTAVSAAAKTATVAADLIGAVEGVTVTEASGATVTIDEATATAAFSNLEWNQGVEWTMTAQQTAADDAQTAEYASLPGKFYVKPETQWFTATADSLAAVSDGSDAAVGYTAPEASGEGEMVRVHTKIAVPAGGLPQAPYAGSAKVGFAVLQLENDTAPAYYAFGNGAWTKLSGAEPTEGDHDYLAVYDLAAETPTARYYIDGVALYKAVDGGDDVYALPLGNDVTSLKSISFASKEMVKSDIVAEQDVSYVAAVDTTPYTEIGEALTAAGTAGEKTLALLKTGVALDPAVSLGSGEKLVVDYAKGTFTNETPVVSGVAGYDIKVTEAETVKTYELDPIVYPIEYVLNGGDNDPSNTNEYTVAILPLALADATRTGYRFDGWTNNVSGNAVATSIPVGTIGAVTNVATWTINSYALTINYLYTNGTAAATQFTSNVVYDTAYSVNSPVIAGYTADKLLVSGTMGAAPVTVDVTYTVNRHTVAFVDEDGTVLKAATEYDYGTPADAIAKPETPTKAATAEKVYTFAGWKPAVETVTSNAVYKASYSEADTKAAVITVAQDGTTNTIYVATIADAIAAAGDGDTIQLIGDVEGDATIEKDVTIDLNGNTWTGDVSVSGEVKIVDGSDVADGKLDGTVAVAEGGSVDVSGGIVDDGITGAGDVKVSGGTVNGGITGSGEIAVSGGTVNGGVVAKGEGAKATIAGGKISGGVTVADGATGSVSGDDTVVNGTLTGTEETLVIDGGHFDNDPSAYVKEGYVAVADTPSGYKVQPGKSVIGTTITVAGGTYNGQAYEIGSVVLGDYTLTASDYTVVYTNVIDGVATNDNVNAGTVTATIAGIGEWIDTTNVTFTIAKAPLTITADNLTVPFRTPAADVEYTLSYSGFVNGETNTVFTTQATATSTYDDATAKAGDTFPITVSGAVAANYEITFVEGTLTVGAAEAPTILGTTSITVAQSTVTLQHVLQTGAKYYTYFTATSLAGPWTAAEDSRAAESITPETVTDADGVDHEGTTVKFTGVTDDVRFYQVGYSSVPYASGDAMGEKPAGGEEP